MHPVLIQFGRFTIYTYGLFVALGFLTGIAVARHEARRLGEQEEKIMDLAFWVLIGAIVGARLFYVATVPATYMKHPLEILKVWNGGLVFYGGFIVATIAAFFYMKMHHMAAGRTADIIAPAIAIGHSIGRIGCFFAGCCYGQTCDLPWAVTFTDAHSLAPTGVPLHPAQLYAVFGNLLIFVFLMMFRPYKRFAGQLFLLYIMFYGLMRALIEIFRGDFRGDFIFGILSVSQFIGLSMALIAAVLLVVLLRRRSSSPQKEDEHA